MRLACVLLAMAAAAWGSEPSAIGVTRDGTPIESLLGEGSLDYESQKTQVLLIGGSELALQAWEWFHGDEAAALRQRFALAVVPEAGDLSHGYPPAGEHYGSLTHPEPQYLWRWTGMHAPDIAVVTLEGGEPGWRVPAGLRLPGLAKLGPPDGGSLAGALSVGDPARVGAVPAVERVGARSGRELLAPLLAALDRDPVGLSPARREIRFRLSRTALEVAQSLGEVYGHELPSVAYIPAVALIARLRLGELTGDGAALEEIQKIVQPYLEGKPTLGDKPTGSHLPGHLVFGELARVTGNQAYAKLARRAADLGFDADGSMLASMPFHNEMSDSVFMGCAILAQTGRLTGEARYFRMALRHLRFMQAFNLRADGLYRHSPLDEAAWGRGNGFPALGLTWTLAEMPENMPEREEAVAAYRALLDALIARQDATGMWHQVIDHEESYRELTATSMIGFALARGLREGWIAGERYESALQRAWYGVKTRIGADGSLVDVCTGTGKQPDLRAYLDREAVLGRDDRGGAMALLFAVEMAARGALN